MTSLIKRLGSRLAAVGGILIDKWLGVARGATIFCVFILVGQVIFGIGGYYNSIITMNAGRFIFGIGGESLASAQNAYAVSWFFGKQLNFVFGLQLSFARVVSLNDRASVSMCLAARLGKSSEYEHDSSDLRFIGQELHRTTQDWHDTFDRRFHLFRFPGLCCHPLVIG